MTDILDLIALTADIVAAHVENNSVSNNDLPVLIGNVYNALAGLGTAIEEPAAAQEPAVSVRSSVKPDYIICLEDGKKLKMLKRHLMTAYQMTPDQYRTKWKLPSDYPMVAPTYAATRKDLALRIGLGRKSANMGADVAAAPATPPASIVEPATKPSRKPRAKKTVQTPSA